MIAAVRNALGRNRMLNLSVCVDTLVTFTRIGVSECEFVSSDIEISTRFCKLYIYIQVNVTRTAKRTTVRSYFQ